MSYKSTETDIVRLSDIIKAIDQALEYSRDCLSDEDMQAVMATAYCVAIIGEAANNLTGELLTTYHNIPWSDIIGMRHRIIHGYSRVSISRLQNVVVNHLPELRQEVQKILDELKRKA